MNEPKPASFAAACPTPTPAAKRAAILAELDHAIEREAAPDVLAEEWERLNEGAQICRRRAP